MPDATLLQLTLNGVYGLLYTLLYISNYALNRHYGGDVERKRLGGEKRRGDSSIDSVQGDLEAD